MTKHRKNTVYNGRNDHSAIRGIVRTKKVLHATADSYLYNHVPVLDLHLVSLLGETLGTLKFNSNVRYTKVRNCRRHTKPRLRTLVLLYPQC